MSEMANLLMPKLGLTMEEGTINRWLVEPGRRFAAGTAIVVIETDKIANELEAPASGIFIETLAPEGAVVPVSMPIARWQLDAPNAATAGEVPHGAATAAPHRLDREPEVREPPQSAVTPSSAGRDRILSTPYARRLARERGIDIATIAGTGPRGRVKADDVVRTPLRPMAAGTTVTAFPPATVARAVSIAQVEIDMDALRNIEQSLARHHPGSLRQELVAMAAARAARSLACGIPLGLGIAIEGAQGTAAGRLDLPAHISVSAVTTAIEQARQRALDADAAQEQHGAILLMMGTDETIFYAPAAPPGWSATLGIGAERTRLRLGKDRMVSAGQTMAITLTYDAAELTNGAALRFLSALKRLLEEPLGMLAG